MSRMDARMALTQTPYNMDTRFIALCKSVLSVRGEPYFGASEAIRLRRPSFA